MAKLPKPRVIEDAETFFLAIKANPLYSEFDDKEVIEALEKEFGKRLEAADNDGRSGVGRDRYFYFQGMLGGLYIGWKQWRTHLEATALRTGVDPVSGQPINFSKEF